MRVSRMPLNLRLPARHRLVSSLHRVRMMRVASSPVRNWPVMSWPAVNRPVRSSHVRSTRGRNSPVVSRNGRILSGSNWSGKSWRVSRVVRLRTQRPVRHSPALPRRGLHLRYPVRHSSLRRPLIGVPRSPQMRPGRLSWRAWPQLVRPQPVNRQGRLQQRRDVVRVLIIRPLAQPNRIQPAERHPLS